MSTAARYGIHRALFAGLDEGAYTLPDAVLRARAGVDAIVARLAAVDVPTGALDLRDAAARRLAEQAVTEGALPEDIDLDAMAAARKAQERHVDAVETLRQMADRAMPLFRDLVDEHADVIVIQHLRPAFDDVLAVLRRIAPKVAGMAFNDSRAWVNATAEQRAAHRSIDEVVPRLMAVRAAHGATLDRGRESRRYSSLRNIDDLWPNTREPVPWPEDPRELALWLVTSEADPWMPTAAEEYTVWQDAEADKPIRPILMPGIRSGPPGIPLRTGNRQHITSRRLGGPGEQRVVIPTE